MSSARIVLIDADAASRTYVASILRQQGYEVEGLPSSAGGLEAARHSQPTAIVADPVNLDIPGEQLAARVRGDPALSSVPLIGLSSADDPERLRAWMQAGFAKLLVKSPEAIPALVDALAAYRTEVRASVVEAHGALLTFLSAKGGTGTSSLCANLTMNMAAQRPDSRFVVADLVLPVGSISAIVGNAGRENLVTLAARPGGELTAQFMRQNLPESANWRFRLLAGSPDPEHANLLNVGRIEEIISTLQSAYDFVIVDLGRALSRISLPLIERADLIVMVIGTDVSTVSLSKTVWDYLESKGVQPAAVYTILNRAVGLQGMTKTEAEGIIGLPIRATMPYLAETLTLADNQNIPYSLKYPGDTASIILRDIAGEMLEITGRRHAQA